ncbi:MAG: IS4 family transposase [Phycisphaerales bacterium]|nr:MAG: IS4 family transposase [Phycisphaerales bacterium]
MQDAKRLQGLDDWAVVCQFLPDGWRDAARTQGALRRGRVIREADTLLRVLLLHLAAGCSLKETALRARQAGWCSVSAVAVHKRLRAAEQWLRWMAEQLWRQRPRGLGTGEFRVRAVDATTVQERGATGTSWRVHFGINLADLQCDFFELTDVKGGETFRRLAMARNDLILADRAYGTPPGVAHVVAQDAYVLVRITRQNMPLFTESGKKLLILSRVRRLRIGDIGDWPAWVQRDGRRIRGRLLAIRKSRVATQRARRKLRRKANRNQQSLSKESLQEAKYVVIWTSVPRRKLSAAKALEWYRVRWQVEEWRKALKSGCRIEAAQLKSAEALEQLTALASVVAIRLIQLRDLAQATLKDKPDDPASPSEQPAALQAVVPRAWITVVSHLARCPAEELTQRQFWLTLAKRGGFIGRKSDGMPGWATIWKGWSEVMLIVQGFELCQAPLGRVRCG